VYAALTAAAPKWKGQALAAWLTGCRAADRADVNREQLAAAHLNNKDWRVRAAAIELARAAPSKTLIPPLIDRLKREKGRLQADSLAALRAITGASFATARDWQAWWKGAQDTFEIPRAPRSRRDGRTASSTSASYWEMPVVSERVTFVVDTSGSMLKPFSTGDTSRLEEAQAQLSKVFDALPKGAKVNVISFAADAARMFDDLSTLSARRRKAARTFIEELESKGPTNLYAALQRAFEQEEVDTIFVLTDGRPSSGSVADPGRVRRWAQLWNAGRSIRIHTIALGDESELLEQLAADSGGVYRVAK
ncbi:MAG: VWA domain-containing protein, partial [Planctomycetota bacterium]|nr:VWA domain-containing protein [Planctomycetota bacterium]